MRNASEQPRIRIVKRDGIKKRYLILLYAGSVLLALGIGAVLLLCLKADPVEYYKQMVTMGTIGNRFAYLQYENYIREFVPLLITALALSLAFRMKFWNIGGEGQFILGALAGFRGVPDSVVCEPISERASDGSGRRSDRRFDRAFDCGSESKIRYERNAFHAHAQLYCAVSSQVFRRNEGRLELFSARGFSQTEI